jgi:hypothetical protein
MSVPACRFCDGGVLYGPGDQLRPCLICNNPTNGHRPDDTIPVGLRELYSRLRAVQGMLRVAKQQSHGTHQQRQVARENVRHALRAVDALLVDLEMFGVPT